MQAANSYTVDEEHTLVQAAKAGDVAAFEQLYRHHVGKVRGLIWRISGCSAKTDDLTQDTFIQAWRKLGSFKAQAAFATWLHRIAVNIALADKRGRLQLVSATDDELARHSDSIAADPANGSDLADLGNPADQANDLDAAIAALPERARTVLVLSAIYGYQHTEISNMTGMAVGTSKAHLHRARQLMQEYLS